MSEQPAVRRPVYSTDPDAYRWDKRRKHWDERRTPDVCTLHTTHQRMIEMHIQGLGNHEIALALDCTPETVSRVLGSRMAMVRIGELNRMVEQTAVDDAAEIHRMTADALKLVHDTIKGKVPLDGEVDKDGNAITQTATVAQRLAAANSVLDRNPDTAKVGKVAELDPSDDQVDAFVARLKERVEAARLERAKNVVQVEGIVVGGKVVEGLRRATVESDMRGNDVPVGEESPDAGNYPEVLIEDFQGDME